MIPPFVKGEQLGQARYFRRPRPLVAREQFGHEGQVLVLDILQRGLCHQRAPTHITT